ncbi:MAG: tRNA pseudouridine(54/55) synthase Pus10 [Candidatus Odinarchaeia archaeon]
MIGEILTKSLKLLKNLQLCDNCLGRLFGMLGSYLTNKERGLSIKMTLFLEADKLLKEGDEKGIKIIKILADGCGFEPAVKFAKLKGIELTETRPKCYLCNGIFPNLIDKVKHSFEELKKYDFKTFLVGTKINESIIEREDNLRVKYGFSWGESIKGELNREIGKLIKENITDVETDFDNPEIVIQYTIPDFNYEINVNPIFIYGRYNKLVRGIPQTKWICKNCNGKGCEKCDYKGKLYDTSVEELITEPVLKTFEAIDSKFHGAGREDIDATMGGSGRPFVLELKGVKKRNIDLSELEVKVNNYAGGKVKVRSLKYTDKETVRKIKALSKIIKKTYRALVRLDNPISEEEVKKAEEELKGALIEQRTPIRVVHRRADKIREKKIYDIKIKIISPTELEIIVECQGGLYVKELISGDNGRTTPSLAEILKTEASCYQLDVLDVDLPDEIIEK